MMEEVALPRIRRKHRPHMTEGVALPRIRRKHRPHMTEGVVLPRIRRKHHLHMMEEVVGLPGLGLYHFLEVPSLLSRPESPE